jgi:hypothetical protein
MYIQADKWPVVSDEPACGRSPPPQSHDQCGPFQQTVARDDAGGSGANFTRKVGRAVPCPPLDCQPRHWDFPSAAHGVTRPTHPRNLRNPRSKLRYSELEQLFRLRRRHRHQKLCFSSARLPRVSQLRPLYSVSPNSRTRLSALLGTPKSKQTTVNPNFPRLDGIRIYAHARPVVKRVRRQFGLRRSPDGRAAI